MTAPPPGEPAVYLDAASAVPPHPVTRQALVAALEEGWADPARPYAAGRRARHLLDAARATVADAVGVREDEVSFCSSGTRAAELAVAGLREGYRRAGTAVAHSAIEHSAVLHAVGEHGRPVPVDRSGRLDLAEWRAAATAPGVAAAALIAASHEVGTRQPVEAAAEACAGVPLYVDAAQALPWGPVPGAWSVLSASAHKWGGPPGVGLLVVRRGTRWPVRPGAEEREYGRVPGPPDLPAIVAAAASLRAVRAEAAAQAARLSALVDRIRAEVPARVPDVEVVGDPDDRLPNLVTFSCLYVDGEALLHGLDRHGFAVSSGSSCTSSTLRPSHVLEAMGVLSHGNVRVSLHRDVTTEQVDRFLDVLPRVVADLREQAGVVGL